MFFKKPETEIKVTVTRNNKYTVHYLFIGLFSLFMMAFTESLFPLPASGYVDVWSMCNWGLTYETGFIIRGLVGTVLMLFTDAVSFKLVYIISAVLLLILIAQFMFINISIYKRSKNIAGFILIFFVMSQPGNARWLFSGSMFARLDFFVMIFALIILYILYKSETDWIYLMILPLSLLAILIHEVFAVAFASLIFALLTMKKSLAAKKLNLKPLLFYYAPVIAFFIVIIAYGGTDLSREKFTYIMQQNLAPDLRDGMVSVARDVVSDGLSMKLERVRYLFTPDTRNLMIMTYIVLAPTLVLFAGLFIKLFKVSKHKFEKISILLIAGSCFAPLTSSLYGCDHFRWIGYFIFCLSAAMVFLYFLNDKYKDIVIEYINKYALYFIMASVISMTFGTFRNMQTMPLLEKFYFNRLLPLFNILG